MGGVIMKSFDDKWEQIHKEQDWGRYPSEEVIRFVARNYYNRSRAEVKMLDIGCGAGAITWYLAKEGFNAYGFDGSFTAIEKAKDRMRGEGVNAELIVCDATNLIYEDNYFDGVIDSAVIYANRLEHIYAILNECYRVLKNGGLHFSTLLINSNTTGYGTGEKLEANTFRNCTEGCAANKGTVHFFSEKEIIEIWTQIGFKNIKIDYVERTDKGGVEKLSYFMVEAEK
jgi:ubiquinone/menaquinone biosynthesis C-methylase UbiE